MRAVEGSLGHPLQYWGGGVEGEERKEGRPGDSPVLAQRAVADSPRWTRARWEAARPSSQCWRRGRRGLGNDGNSRGLSPLNQTIYHLTIWRGREETE